MEPHPAELRQRVVAAYARGDGTMRELAERFDVSLHFVNDMVQLARRTGSVAPKPHSGGRTTRLDDRALAALRAWVARRPDATLRELGAHLWRARHLAVSTPTLSRALRRLGLTRKKRRSGPTSASARTSWKRAIATASRSSTSRRGG
jgi:transposase